SCAVDGVEPAWYRNGCNVSGETVVFAALPTVSTTAIAIESGVVVLCTNISPKYVPVKSPAGFTPISSGVGFEVPNAVLPLDVKGISQLRPLYVVAVTLYVSDCPPAEITAGIAAGLPCVAPSCAEKFKMFGLAVNSVRPPTVIVTRIVVGFCWLFCAAMVNDVW